jgi:hypothetical protein
LSYFTVARHFQIGFRVCRVHHLTGPRTDLVVERHQTIRFEPAFDIASVYFDRPRGHVQKILTVLAADNVESQRDLQFAAIRMVKTQMKNTVS